jgi:hypothetical protein
MNNQIPIYPPTNTLYNQVPNPTYTMYNQVPIYNQVPTNTYIQTPVIPQNPYINLIPYQPNPYVPQHVTYYQPQTYYPVIQSQPITTTFIQPQPIINYSMPVNNDMMVTTTTVYKYE